MMGKKWVDQEGSPLARRKQFYASHAASTVQGAILGHVGRACFATLLGEEQAGAVQVLQGALQGAMQRGLSSTQEEQVLIVQAGVVGAGSRALVAAQLAEEDAAAAEVLEALVRGRIQRCAVEGLEEAALVLQASIQGHVVRAKTAAPTIVGGTGTHGEHLVKHTWVGAGPLGLKIAARGTDAAISSRGVIVSEVPDPCLPAAIQPGMCLHAVNGQVVSTLPYDTVVATIKAAGRPLTLSFSATVEHMVLMMLQEQFLLADIDESGALGREELAAVLKAVYKAGATSYTIESGCGLLSCP